MALPRLDTFTFTTLTAAGLPGAPNSAYMGIVNGNLTVVAGPTFGGGTLTLEATLDNGATWFAVGGFTMSAPGLQTVTLVANGVRPRLTGGVAPSIVVTIAIGEQSP